MKKYLSLLIAVLFTLSLNAGGGKAKIVGYSSGALPFLQVVNSVHCQNSFRLHPL